jgi:hypothetical protein
VLREHEAGAKAADLAQARRLGSNAVQLEGQISIHERAMLTLPRLSL